MRFLKRLLGEIRGRAGAGGGPPGRASVQAQFRHCVALSDAGEVQAALDCYTALLRTDPGHARARNNLGLLYQRRGDYSAARACFEAAVRADGGLAAPHINLGNLQDIRGDAAAAASHYRRALRIEPDNAHAHCCLSQALLSLGDYAAGWEEYEWRWRGPGTLTQPALPQPEWDGRQGLEGKSMLVYTEQGHGDALQFARYVPMLAERGARVHLACEAALERLFRTLPGVAGVVGDGAPLPATDCRAALLSLPRAFGTRVETIPGSVPYLAARPEAVTAWDARLARDGARLRVGLAWSGRPTFVAARLKACPAAQIARLLATRGCAFYSLQKDAPAADLEALRKGDTPFCDHTSELEDFADTAALVSALDLVISIDTAVAHLAGALAKPVWVLLSAVPDWRWFEAAGARAWYPTARLFRQPREGDWSSVIAEVRAALDSLAGKGRP